MERTPNSKCMYSKKCSSVSQIAYVKHSTKSVGKRKQSNHTEDLTQAKWDINSITNKRWPTALEGSALGPLESKQAVTQQMALYITVDTPRTIEGW